MSGAMRDAITKLATSTYLDPTATAREKRLAAAWLLHVTGKVPK